MNRIIYCSQATRAITDEELVTLLEVSRRNNEKAGLSGMLLYAEGSFLQVLEGEPDALAARYERITVDDRHTSLRLLMDAVVEEPMFGDWSMGFDHVDAARLGGDLPGFTPASTYPLVNPNLVTDAGVAKTLLQLYARNRATA